MASDASHFSYFFLLLIFLFPFLSCIFLLIWRIRSHQREIQILRQKHLEQSQRFRALADQAEYGVFLLGFFHDVATPLSVLSLYLDELNARQWIMPHQREHQALVDGAVRSHMIINEYVVHAHDRFRETSTDTEFNVLDLLAEVIAQHSPRAQKMDVEIQTLALSEIDLVYGAKIRLFQVFNNLMANALDAYEKCSADGKREILIVVSNRDQEVNIEVTDWAGGISSEDHARIFEPFFSTKDDSHFGVGLAVCRQIIENEWRGSLTCHSDHLAGWTRLQIQIPVNRNQDHSCKSSLF